MPNPPRSYYNEIDPFAAAWLRNLIREGLIADGDVDTRSIVDVRPYELRSYVQCHFFAGIGGWSLALRRAGWPDHRAVWTGSCPCQPFSLAGKRAGFADDRHLWPYWRYFIEIERPATVFGEQVASAADWLRLVRSDLEALDYAVGAIPVEAASAGADHLRDRYWFVGHAHGAGLEIRSLAESKRGDVWSERAPAASPSVGSDVGLAYANDARSQGRQLLPERPDGVAHTASDRCYEQCGIVRVEESAWERWDQSGDRSTEWVIGADGKARRVKSGVRLLADGLPNRMGILRGFGNAIDPRPAAAYITAAREAMEAFT